MSMAWEDSVADALETLAAQLHLNFAGVISQMTPREKKAALRVCGWLRRVVSKQNDALKKQRYVKALQQVEMLSRGGTMEDAISCLTTSVELGSVKLAVATVTRLRSLVGAALAAGKFKSDGGNKILYLDILSKSPEMLIKMMTAFVSISVIQLHGLAVLKLCDPSALYRTNMCDLLFDIWRRHLSDSNVCLACIGLGEHLCGESDFSIAMGQKCWCDLLVRVMRRHQDESDMLTKLLVMVCKLSGNSIENQIQLGRSGMCDEVRKWMLRNVEHENVVMICCRTLLILISLSRVHNVIYFSQSEHFDAYADMIYRNSSNSTFCRGLCGWLSRVYDGGGDAAFNERLVSSRMCKILVTRIDELFWNVQSPAATTRLHIMFAVILNMLKKIDILRKPLVDAGLIDVLKPELVVDDDIMTQLISKTTKLLSGKVKKDKET